jgi:glycosyltransferase involved in cell wall biosynthesis
VFVSETSARVMAPRMAAPPGRVRVVPYGWRPVDPVARTAGPTLPDRYVLTVGELLEHKNVETLLHAFQRLVDARGYRGDLVIVGGRPPSSRRYVRSLEALRARLPCAGRIRFVGARRPDVLAGVYRRADLFVLPSLEETFGLPLVEAMGAAVPVAVGDWRLAPGGEAGRTNVGPEICGDAAELFDPTDPESMADAMWRVLADPGRRDELARAGPARARTFSWERAAGAMLEIFDESVTAPDPA